MNAIEYHALAVHARSVTLLAHYRALLRALTEALNRR